MKKIILLISLSILNINLYAQQVCDSTNWAKSGTYEIIHIEGSTEEIIPPIEILSNETLCMIEQNRQLNDIIDLQISPFTIIRIFPKNRKKDIK